MFGDKKIDIYEDHNSLGITLDWYTWGAWFLLLFTIIWNLFLVFWYSMAIENGAPLIFRIFPLLHVGAGIAFFYYAMCSFFNTTYIDVMGGYLTVVHKPIPWWRGNKQLIINDIEQLYVKETKVDSKNDTRYVYELRAKMKDKSDEIVLKLDELSSQKLQEIEAHLEKFIGINDYPVKGEYSKGQSAVQKDQIRRFRRDFSDSNLGAIYNFRVGGLINLKNEELKIISITQYDWIDGNSDKLFQLVDTANKERLLYLEQNKALLNAYQEKPLSIIETNSISFQTKNPPQSIELKGARYLLSHVKRGKKFISGIAESIETMQWMYADKDEKTYIRVVDNQSLIHFFQGKKLQAIDFEDTLDLNNPPLKDMDFENRSWDDEDLV